MAALAVRAWGHCMGHAASVAKCGRLNKAPKYQSPSTSLQLKVLEFKFLAKPCPCSLRIDCVIADKCRIFGVCIRCVYLHRIGALRRHIREFAQEGPRARKSAQASANPREEGHTSPQSGQ